MSLENQIIKAVKEGLEHFVVPSKLYTRDELLPKLGISIKTFDRMIRDHKIKVHELIPNSPKSRRYCLREILDKTEVIISS